MPKRLESLRSYPPFRVARLNLCITGITLIGSMQITQADVGIQWNGFGTVGAAQNDSPSAQYLSNSLTNMIGNQLTFEPDTRIGINATANLQERWTLATQFLASGRSSEYNLMAEWFFATYRPNDHFSVSAGRIKSRTWLMSDRINVGYIRPWIRPPEEVYSMNPLSSLNGAAVNFSYMVGKFDLNVELYGGAVPFSFTFPTTVNMPSATTAGAASLGGVALPATNGSQTASNAFSGTANYLKGGTVSLGNDEFLIRAGYVNTLISYTSTLTFPSTNLRDPNGTGHPSQIGVLGSSNRNVGLNFLSFGGKMDWNNFVVFAEYAKRFADGGYFKSTEGFYTTVGYRIGPFLPHFTYVWYDDQAADAIRARLQSAILGLKVVLSNNVSLKTEWQRTQLLDSPQFLLNGTPGLGAISGTGRWSANPGSDPVNFYSLAMDFVF